MRKLACAFFVLTGLAVNGAANLCAAAACDRACLGSILDQYLNAVVKHDPAAAPLFIGFRQTDNAVVVRTGNDKTGNDKTGNGKPGSGVWKTITALGKIQRRYLDPVNESAGYFGTIEEGGDTAVATLRIKVDNRRITEAEWVIGRSDPGRQLDISGLVANPPPDHPVAKENRSAREVMIAAANSYFDGVETHDGSVILAHPGCFRIENGRALTGRPPFTDCTASLERVQIPATVARRYPVVDEEAGVVLGMTIFIRPPGVKTRRNLLNVHHREQQDQRH